MKVLLVSEYFPPQVFGGGEISAEHLAKGLSERGVEVSVLTSRFPDRKDELRDKVRIYRRLHTSEPGSILGNIKRKILLPLEVRRELWRLDRKENFDLIHFLNTTTIVPQKKRTIATINGYGNFCPKGNLFYKEREVCSGCNFSKYIPCIINSEYSGKVKLSPLLKYNPIFWLLSYWNYWRRKRLLHRVDEFIAISDFIKTLLIQAKIKENQIHKIPNVISIQDFEKKYPLNIKSPLVTYIGALEKIKGVDLLIETIKRVKWKSTLVIVGEGSERKKLEGMADSRVKFLGAIDYEYIPSIYRKSSIIVLPARWPEPLPRVLIEACYFGIPLLATRVGGNPDCVIDGRNGFLVKPEAKEIKEKLDILLEDPVLRESMGQESRKIFQERFKTEKVVEEIIKIYEGG